MRYFMIRTHPLYTNAPDIINWYNVFDKRNIRPGASHLLPERALLRLRPNPNTVFCDVVTYPYLLVTNIVKEAILIYQPKTIFKEIILLDERNDLAETYYLPVLPVVDCLHASSEMNNDRSVIYQAALDTERVGEEKFFRIGGLFNAYYIVHVDLAESILRRGARGVGLTPATLYPETEIYETKGRF